VEVTGSLKFDAEVPGGGKPSAALRLIPGTRPVWVAGSTLAPEEEILLDVYRQLKAEHEELFLLLAPRHPDRFDEVVELASAGPWKTVRRTALKEPDLHADVMVLDTLGELASVYACADVVFVGGSLATWGGHNLIEPALVGKPIVFGPHMSNFKEMASMFLEADGAVQVADRDRLREALEGLLADPKRRALLGENARRLVEDNRGAGKKTIEAARKILRC
jgi:3-deoxy-D-manno-octulosonic-acid transferase